MLMKLIPVVVFSVAGKVKDETEVTEGKRGGVSGESGNTVSDDYEYGESELGQLIGAKPRRTPEQTYRLNNQIKIQGLFGIQIYVTIR